MAGGQSFLCTCPCWWGSLSSNLISPGAQFILSELIWHAAFGRGAKARVQPGSSVPVAPETTEWRTQSVQLGAAISQADAFLQGGFA